jgi:hypothetical protein
MLDYILALAVSTAPSTIQKNQNPPVIVVGKEISSKTEQRTGSISLEDMKENSVATFWNDTPEVGSSADVPYVSPAKSTIKVKATYVIGGKISQPPVDDDLVYLDE